MALPNNNTERRLNSFALRRSSVPRMKVGGGLQECLLTEEDDITTLKLKRKALLMQLES